LNSAEKAMCRKFPCDFVEALQASIEAYKREIGPKGPTVTFIVAPTQADPCVAKLVVDGDAIGKVTFP